MNEDAFDLFHKANNSGNRLSPEEEEIIKKDPLFTFLYIREIIKERWKEAEETLINSVACLYGYAVDVIKGKLPENLHNFMILRGIEKHFFAMAYFDYLKKEGEGDFYYIQVPRDRRLLFRADFVTTRKDYRDNKK